MKKKSAKKAANNLPNKIKCSACGKAKGVRPDVLQKRVKDYGTLENLLETYECQKCRKRPESQAPTAKKVRKMAGADEVHPDTGEKVYFWQMPGWELETKRTPFQPAASREQYMAAFNTACGRPDIFMKNGRFCDGCPYFDVCACVLKRRKSDGGLILQENGETKKMSYYMRKKLGLLKWTKKTMSKS